MNDKFVNAMWETHYSNVRLAEEAEVSLTTIFRLRKGIAKKPHYATLKRIADCLGKTVEELF